MNELNRNEFELSKELTELDLYKIFSAGARYVKISHNYFIVFNGKILHADTPEKLFTKLKLQYEDYVQRNR